MDKRQTRGLLSYPGYFLALLLDIRCHNCGVQTASLLIGNCSRCGHPLHARFECKSCGLRVARAKKAICPKCGSPVVDLQSNPNVTESPPEPETLIAVATTATETRTVETSAPPPEPVASEAPPVVPETSPIPETPLEEKTRDAINLPPVIELPPPPIKELPALSEEFSVSIEQLAAVFNTDSSKAFAEYQGKLLRIKGIVEAVNIMDSQNPHLIMSSIDPKVTQKVRCAFEAKYLPVLGRISAGQKITALGKYNGFDVDFQLVDCMPVG